MKHLSVLSRLLRAIFGSTKTEAETMTPRVLPPENIPPLDTLLQQIEGYINAIKMQKDSYDTSCFRYLCQTHSIDPATAADISTDAWAGFLAWCIANRASIEFMTIGEYCDRMRAFEAAQKRNYRYVY